MGKLTLADLKKLRDDKKKEMTRRDTDKDVVVTIGMGTCGIAAGAKETFDALISALDASDVENVVVKQTGCMGFCAIEPTVEIQAPGMPDTIYNKVDTDIAKRLVQEHIVDKKLVSEYITDKPSTDIMA